MKQTFILAMLLAIGHSLNAQVTSDSLARSIETAFDQGHVEEAIAGYETLSKSVANADVYLNLGNAYHQQNLLGHAIHSYMRGLLIAPDDEDLRHNVSLSLSEAGVSDIYLQKSLSQRIVGSRSANHWAWISVISAMICALLIFLFLKNFKPKMRSIMIIGAILSGCFALVSMRQSLHGARMLYEDNRSVVLQGVEKLHSAPNDASDVIHSLPTGTIVREIHATNGWSEISWEPDRKGWIHSEGIRSIALERRTK